MSGKIPKHGPQLVLFMEADPMIDGIEFVRILLEEDMAAFSIGVVAKQIEEGDGLEELLVSICEIEVMIFRIVFDQLLERPRAVGTILAQCGERDDVKTEMLADEVRGDLPACERVLGEIPKRLLAAHGFVNGRVFPALVLDNDKKRVIRAKHELARDLVIAVLQRGL